MLKEANCPSSELFFLKSLIIYLLIFLYLPELADGVFLSHLNFVATIISGFRTPTEN